MEELSKAFRIYAGKPFLFVWGSLLYIISFILCLFAAAGIFLLYFMALALLGQPFSLESIPTIVIGGLVIFIFLFLSKGLEGALLMAYNNALTKNKTSLTKFFSYAMYRAPEMFGISLIRDILFVLLVAPLAAIYFFVLSGIPYLDILLGVYTLLMFFLTRLMFAPAIVFAGAFETGMFDSLKKGFGLIKTKNIYFMILYGIFAFVWILNSIPFIQIVTFFFAYPVVQSAMILMMKGSGKVDEYKDEEEE